MLGRLGRWWIDGVVMLFAMYAFVFLPLGKRTAFEHVRAVLATRAARDAGRELVQAGERLKNRVLEETIDTRGRPEIPELPEGAPVEMRLAPFADAPDASLSDPGHEPGAASQQQRAGVDAGAR